VAKGKKDTYRRHKSVTIIVGNNKDLHLRNTEGRRLGKVSSIFTAGEFKPVNYAPNLSFLAPSFPINDSINETMLIK
jgi:hypothetical protein